MSEISRIEYTKPDFGNKYRNFMIYKKQTMITEIDEIKVKYNTTSRDRDNGTCNGDLSSTYTDLLSYVVKYRPIACPNERFRSQLISLL